MTETPSRPDDAALRTGPDERAALEAQPDEPAALSPEVLRGLPERDPVALEAFFDAFFPRVYGYVRRLVGDEHLAEDLTQDVFVHIHRALATYDPERDLRPWVFTIATNKVRDFWRSRRHREATAEQSLSNDGQLADDLDAGSERPDSDLRASETGDEVRAAVDRLPEGMRMTVLLRVYEGLSFEAIGEILERNEVAVRKRYSRALEALRSNLGPAWQA